MPAAEVRQTAGAVVAVGHSDTVAEIVAALSSSRPTRRCETPCAHRFIATPTSPEFPPNSVTR